MQFLITQQLVRMEYLSPVETLPESMEMEV